MTGSKQNGSISKPNGADVDLIIIGGGSAGFAAAIRGHELGAQVIMINAGVIGGTCVNVGCIPSKTLIRAAEAWHRAARSRFAGVESTSHVSDFAAIIRQKDELASSLRQAKYIDVLTAYENVRLIEGRAAFVSSDTIQVDGRKLRAPRIIVTTGSRPWMPPIPGLREVACRSWRRLWRSDLVSAFPRSRPCFTHT
jgi:mercuric reductase